MAKVTIADNSDQADIYKNTGLGNFLVGQKDRGGQPKSHIFEYTNTTGGTLADGSYIELCKVGPGKILPTSHVSTSAMGTSRVLNIGLQEYTDRDGATVAADANKLLAAYDVSSATYLKQFGTDTASETAGAGLAVNGQVAVLAQVTGGTIPANATIKGVIQIIEN